MTEKEGGLVVESRPQISVSISDTGNIVIDVSSIGDDFEHVEIKCVEFPAECASVVAKALLELAGGN